MCGRYTLISPPAKLRWFLSFTVDESYLTPRFNIAPTQAAPVAVAPGELKCLRWGLDPSWGGAKKAVSLLINARAETAHQKPFFKNLLAHQRCAVLADGFFEWKKTGKARQPYRFQLQSGDPFAFAGIWGRCHDESGRESEAYVILTTAANDLVSPIHNRMPVILDREACGRWLQPDPVKSVKDLGLLDPFPPELMTSYPVTPRMNTPTFAGPECIQPLQAEAAVRQLQLLD